MDSRLPTLITAYHAAIEDALRLLAQSATTASGTSAALTISDGPGSANARSPVILEVEINTPALRQFHPARQRSGIFPLGLELELELERGAWGVGRGAWGVGRGAWGVTPVRNGRYAIRKTGHGMQRCPSAKECHQPKKASPLRKRVPPLQKSFASP